MTSRSKSKHETLTDLEFKIINKLWDLGGGTVREVVDAQDEKPPLAYTTVATVLKILEDKGFVRSNKKGRVLVYTAKLKRQSYQARSLRDMVDRVFSGDALSLVTRLIDTQPMTDDDLQRLRALINQEEASHD
ncbi:MAG: BlaI/MecI/CopY family transcriptional regulator [Myxococcota bacterium]